MKVLNKRISLTLFLVEHSRKDCSMLFGMFAFVVGAFTVLTVAFVYLRQMGDEMMK